MKQYTIRPMGQHEYPLLKNFVYEAIFQHDGLPPLPREIIEEPAILVYTENFGEKPDDLCLLAECDDQVVGAVWTRILSGTVKGFGYLDDSTPEFSISLYKDYRGTGIGTALMKDMLELLCSRGYKQATLSVHKDNYAAQMYAKLGFRILREGEDDYLMIYEF